MRNEEIKIYFAASVRAGREDADVYHYLVRYLGKYGRVLTEHLGDKELPVQGENLPDKVIHDRDLEWLLDSDVVVSEGTTPSLGVGYEIGRAVDHNIPVFCLYRTIKDCLFSSMINGSPGVVSKEYASLSEAELRIDEFMSSLGYNKKISN